MNSRFLSLLSLSLYFPLGCLLVFPADAQRAGGPPKPNVILITIDTLRPDHLGCYGYKAIQTPHIDKLASESARFTTVVSQVPQTLPSHCTILTSTYPMFH